MRRKCPAHASRGYIPTLRKPCRRNKENPTHRKIKRPTGLPTIIISLNKCERAGKGVKEVGPIIVVFKRVGEG